MAHGAHARISSGPRALRGDALFDDRRIYRYRLTRSWGHCGGNVCWIMLNPSRATATLDDPTSRRVIGFSESWGYASCSVVNLFAFRSTEPTCLRHTADPVGPRNDQLIVATASRADRLVLAWGNRGGMLNPQTGVAREDEVMELLAGIEPLCLGVTGSGRPRHPLYLPAETTPVPYSPSPALRGRGS